MFLGGNDKVPRIKGGMPPRESELPPICSARAQRSQKVILGMRNLIFGMASQDLSKANATILGATPGVLLRTEGNPHEGMQLPPNPRSIFPELGWSPHTAVMLLVSLRCSAFACFFYVPEGSIITEFKTPSLMDSAAIVSIEPV